MGSPMRQAATKNLSRATYQASGDNRIIGPAEEEQLLKNRWQTPSAPAETTIKLKGSGLVSRGKGQILPPITGIDDTLADPTGGYAPPNIKYNNK